MDGDTLYVNHVRHNAMFDFDAVEVGLCSSDQVDAFVVGAANDPYRQRRKRRRKRDTGCFLAYHWMRETGGIWRRYLHKKNNRVCFQPPRVYLFNALDLCDNKQVLLKQTAR